MQPVAWKRFHRIFKRRYFRISRPSFTTRKSLRTAKGLTTALSIPIGRKTQTLENRSPKQKKNRCNRWVFAGHTPLLRSFAESKKFLYCIKLVFTAECIGLPGCPHHEEIAAKSNLKSYPSSHDAGMTLVASTMMTSKMLLSLHHHRQPWSASTNST